ncbi:MAG: hypothetical protein AABW47_02215 [Nanoarchaeota archaeon]
MGLFGKKKEKVVDWSEGYKPSSEKSIQTSSSRLKSKPETVGDLGFLGSFSNINSNSSNSSSDVSWDNDAPQQVDYSEKKQKVAKRLLDMTNKMEDLSNQIYHLTQRVELLEKKLRITSD